MVYQLKHGMGEVTTTKLADRKRAKKRRKLKNFSILFSSLFVALLIGLIFYKPVFAPELKDGIPIGLNLNQPELTENQQQADFLNETQMFKTQQAVISSLPTQAQSVIYPKDTPILYYAQSGDSLAVLSIHFGVEMSEITSTSPIPQNGLISPGQLLLIPSKLDAISSPLKLMPDSEIVNSPSSVDFDIENFVKNAGGYLHSYSEYLSSTGKTSGAEIIKRVSIEYSINPRLLLALLQYQSGWVYGGPENLIEKNYPLGNEDINYLGLYKQAVWAAGEIMTGYYGWREGTLVAIDFPDKSILRLAPDLNSGTVGLHYYFSRMHNLPDWADDLYGEKSVIGLHREMFGNPWIRAQVYEPLFNQFVSQPDMILPFEIGPVWALTGGPHASWGAAQVRGALDFAPPSNEGGCIDSDEWVVASVSGLVVRSGNGAVVIDMDEDGYEQTGWNIIYLHIATKHRVPLGTFLKVGDRIGHPSCEGGVSTGTHVHITRKYNGEWVPADGPLPFILSGWRAKAGASIYTGWLIKEDRIVRASMNSSSVSHIQRYE